MGRRSRRENSRRAKGREGKEGDSDPSGVGAVQVNGMPEAEAAAAAAPFAHFHLRGRLLLSYLRLGSCKPLPTAIFWISSSPSVHPSLLHPPSPATLMAEQSLRLRHPAGILMPGRTLLLLLSAFAFLHQVDCECVGCSCCCLARLPGCGSFPSLPCPLTSCPLLLDVVPRDTRSAPLSRSLPLMIHPPCPSPSLWIRR